MRAPGCMQDNERNTIGLEERSRPAEVRLRSAEDASGIGTFEVDRASGDWDWSQQAAVLFGIDPQQTERSFAKLQQVIFIDDVPKIHAALANAPQTGSYSVEFRVKHPDGSLHWIAAKGRIDNHSPALLRGAIFDITERKALEARLLSVNETSGRGCARGRRSPSRRCWRCSGRRGSARAPGP